MEPSDASKYSIAPVETERKTLENQVNIEDTGRSESQVTSEKQVKFTIGSTEITGTVDAEGNLMVHYPSNLRGNIQLLRYDGSLDDNIKPFSKEHCDSIRRMVNHGLGNFVRSGFQSLFKFEIPMYISSYFTHEIMKKSESLGFPAGNLSLKNPIDYSHGKINLIFLEGSISKTIGNIEFLEEQLNLSHKGNEVDRFNKTLLILSRDIICDFATRQAKMEMIYPIKGHDGEIKVVFDSLII